MIIVKLLLKQVTLFFLLSSLIERPIIKKYAATKSILGVCLGHQAIGEAFGARLENLKEVYHGVQTPVSILRQDVLFEGLGKEIPVGRYHSWVVSREDFPDE